MGSPWVLLQESTKNPLVGAARALRSKLILHFTDEKSETQKGTLTGPRYHTANSGTRLCFLLLWPWEPLPFLSQRQLAGWETGFQEAQAESQKSQAFLSPLSPCLLKSCHLKAAPRGDSSCWPWPILSLSLGRGELLWGLPQSIVCSSVFVCHSEVNCCGVRSGQLVEKEKEACPCGGAGRQAMGYGEECGSFNPLISPSLIPRLP